MVTIVQTLPEAKWRHFVREHPNSNIFLTPEMFRVFAGAQNHEPELWAVTNHYGEPLALLTPVHVTLFPFLPRQLTTRSIAYGSLLCNPAAEPADILPTLLHAYNQRTARVALFTELRHKSDITACDKVLQEQGYIRQDELNFLVDLSRTPNDLLESIGARTRKNIRRGLRKNEVRIMEARNQTDFNHWHRALQKTYRHAQVPLAPQTLFQSAFNELVPKGMAKFLLALVEDVPVACSLELLYKDTIYGWYNGVDRAYSRFNPNEMLTWHILYWGAENGYRVYDWGGAGKPDENYGVRDFKAKFGGKVVNYGRHICVHAPLLLQLGEQAYKLYRKLL